jgi:hypothetical protein
MQVMQILNEDLLLLIFQWLNFDELSIICDVSVQWNNVAKYFVKHQWNKIQTFQFCEKFTKTDRFKSEKPYFVFLLEDFGILIKAYNINNDHTRVTFSTKFDEWEFYYYQFFTVISDYSFHLNDAKNKLTIMAFYNQQIINDRLIPKSKEEFDIRRENQTIHINYYGGCILSMYELIVSQNVCDLCRFSPHELKRIKDSRFLKLFNKINQ